MPNTSNTGVNAIAVEIAIEREYETRKSDVRTSVCVLSDIASKQSKHDLQLVLTFPFVHNDRAFPHKFSLFSKR